MHTVNINADVVSETLQVMERRLILVHDHSDFFCSEISIHEVLNIFELKSATKQI